MNDMIQKAYTHLQLAILVIMDGEEGAFTNPLSRQRHQRTLKNVAYLFGLKPKQIFLGADRDNRVYIDFGEDKGFFAFTSGACQLRPFASDHLAWECREAA